ncbi:DNA-binding HxlR family transcriptional regulator [Streptomyces zagrosensis]|uniref:DNA-binding HxlR family transcriptional regulator n=1 Tax=Streptomyces zagrosensis TaxID=1042984 RepID=A0A7W9QF64_9ACTN|nr:DNA-binding HxlR family transcriptional regulator [Streptomyces zagrosensis]
MRDREQAIADDVVGRTVDDFAEHGAESDRLGALGVPKTPDVQAAACPSRLVLEHVTSRWGVLALAALLERTHRFSELRRRVGGVSEKMLAQTLQTLERDGFVHREAYPVIPPRVEYSLTALGEEAAHQVWALARWSERRVPEVLAARDQYDTRRQGTARADTNSASASSVGVASGGRASVGINLAGTSSAGTSSVATSSADTSPVG